jgi:site-specific recombinase XerD
LMLALSYGAGLKVSELVGIQVWDIQAETNSIRIVNKWVIREVPLPLRIKEQLLDFVASKWEKEYVFPWRKWKMLTPRSVQYIFNKYLKKSQITKKISINILRHSFAVHLLDQWVDIHYVQRLLGHKNIRTTQVYKKLTKAPLQNIVSPLK